jgi:cob(I)alamin adenosyltransferase
MGQDDTAKPGDAVYSEPRIAINRVYTKHGDGGFTKLVGGQEVPKDDPRIEAYGTVDELNSFVGAAHQTLLEDLDDAPPHAVARLRRLGDILVRVQNELFNLGSILATLPEDVHPKQPRVTEVDVLALETEMDACQPDLTPLRSFVLPGGSRLCTDLHVARTVCRRAERRCVEAAAKGPIDATAVRYLNRLGDAFFVWSRWATFLIGAKETLWEPNQAASAGGGV